MKIIEYRVTAKADSRGIYRFPVERPCHLRHLEFVDGEMLEFASFHADKRRVTLNVDRHNIDIESSGEPIWVQNEFSLIIRNREPYPIRFTVKVIV